MFGKRSKITHSSTTSRGSFFRLSHATDTSLLRRGSGGQVIGVDALPRAAQLPSDDDFEIFAIPDTSATFIGQPIPTRQSLRGCHDRYPSTRNEGYRLIINYNFNICCNYWDFWFSLIDNFNKCSTFPLQVCFLGKQLIALLRTH